jgi:hypothetical protein
MTRKMITQNKLVWNENKRLFRGRHNPLLGAITLCLPRLFLASFISLWLMILQFGHPQTTHRRAREPTYLSGHRAIHA